MKKTIFDFLPDLNNGLTRRIEAIISEEKPRYCKGRAEVLEALYLMDQSGFATSKFYRLVAKLVKKHSIQNPEILKERLIATIKKSYLNHLKKLHNRVQ